MKTITLLALASLSALPAANLPQITQQTVGIAQALPLPRMAVPGSRQPQLSALHLAALEGDPEEVSQQLSAGANPNDRTTGYGNLTPLHLAANSPSRRAVQTLVEAGASLEARDTTLGTTPVFAAAANFDPNKLALLQLLVSGADPQARSSIVPSGEDSLLPIHLAVGSPSAPALAIQHLLAFGADPNGRARPSGVTALHLAVLHPELTGKPGVDLTVIDALLDPAYSAFGRADINARAAGGFTPLHFALLPIGAGASSPTLLFWLAQGGADLNATADDGSTPLDLAIALHGASSAPAMLLHQLGAQSGGARPATPPGEGQGGEPGESGTQYQKGEIASETREGVVLVIAYDSASDAFIGTVRNTNNQTVQHVRVEVHLSNGVELGPTPRVDLAAGETRTVNLSAESQSFTGFSVHVELGLGEHGGSGGEGGGEGNEGGSGEGSEGGSGEHGGGGESREGGGEHGGGGEGREGGGN